MSVNFLPNMNPDMYAKKYASENNISVNEAKEQLRAKYGDPQPMFTPNSSQSFPFPSENETDEAGNHRKHLDFFC